MTTDKEAASSDLYRIDLLTRDIVLVSATESGHAGNGPSRYPAADASAELIVFESDADDLVVDDRNRASDVFLRDLALGVTQRLSDTDAGAAHPNIDAEGVTVVYDVRGTDGHRAVRAVQTAAGAVGETISLSEAPNGLALDNHHPAISADGRYVAYLEAGTAHDAYCRVHVFDRTTDVYHRQTCPQELTDLREIARPMFSPSSKTIHWYLPAHTEPIVLANPLHEP
jgi:Tol biopolymer transport system component